MDYRKSINIKYDLTDDKLINDYFATSSHSEIIKNVFAGILGNKSRSHIAFGPYGAGKSYISTIITGFLSKKYKSKDDINSFIDKFKLVDTEASDLFKKIVNSNISYIPIIINGYEGSFEEVLTNSLINQVSKFTSLDDYNQDKNILNIIENWNIEYPETYSKFLDFLIKSNIDKHEFVNNLSNQNNILIFKDFYKKVTSGSELLLSKKYELISTFEDIADILKHRDLGIILVYDEFGRLLQNIDESELNKFMQQLQDLAELANNQCENLSLLFVAHKPISHYFSYLDKDRRQEFSKIEKRFSTTSINSDNTTFINISGQIISKYRRAEINENMLNYHLKNLRKYKLFSTTFNDTEVENLIIRGCHPLHPVTVYLLPLISKIFGQNERSLFSFILDKSNIGVLGKIDKNPKIESIKPDSLVDYFFNEKSISNEDDILELDIFKNNYSIINTKIPSLYINVAESIYKFIMLWSITNSNSHFNISSELISYSLNIDIDQIEKTLILLSENNLIRFNVFSNSYELINADYFDFEFEFERRKSVFISHKETILETLNKYNPNKILYAQNHNNKYQITRFAEVIYLSKDYELNFKNDSDFKVLVYLDDIDVKPILNNDTHIFRMLENLTENEIAALKKLHVIELIEKDRHFMIEHKNVQPTLEYERKKQIRILNSLYSNTFKGHFQYLEQNFNVNSIFEFENKLDDISDLLFNETILIQNDQINMFVISKQQENPTIKLLEMILENESSDLYGQFVGNKPDFLIYNSLIQANLVSVSNKILEFLDNYPSGKFSQLTKIVTMPPFGMRPTLSSLIVMLTVIKRWKNIMLFSSGNYIASIDANTIYQSGLGNVDFEYTYSKFDFENSDFINFIFRLFPVVSEGVQNKSHSIKALSALNNWYLSLPVITQLGKNLSIGEISFIKYIQKAKVNPLESLNLIINNFTYDEIEQFKESIELSFDNFLNNINTSILSEIGYDSWGQLLNNSNKALLKSNLLFEIANQHENVIEEYAKRIDTLDIQKWPNAMFDMLKRRIIQDYDSSRNKIDTTTLNIDGIEKEVSNINLSHKASNLKRNLESLIDANSKYLTKPEVEKVVFDLINKYIK